MPSKSKKQKLDADIRALIEAGTIIDRLAPISHVERSEAQDLDH